jgi:murein L,D-transpeptidase YcbB/YkuD
MEFQKANGLTADGVAGDKTKAELVKYLKADGR